jgi:hypothetical protein
VLEYKNMRLGEHFAYHAKMSADTMEAVTLKTKQETVSIHVITILTLIFLPATFVSVRYGLPYLLEGGLTRDYQTFFSSNVLEFGDEGDDGTMGTWKTRWSALKLFGAVCGPLTGLVLLAWAVVYFQARKRRWTMQGQEDEEKSVKGNP